MKEKIRNAEIDLTIDIPKKTRFIQGSCTEWLHDTFSGIYGSQECLMGCSLSRLREIDGTLANYIANKIFFFF